MDSVQKMNKKIKFKKSDKFHKLKNMQIAQNLNILKEN